MLSLNFAKREATCIPECECAARFPDGETSTTLKQGDTGTLSSVSEDLSSEEKSALVNKHNDIRSMVGASNMQCVSWNNYLEFNARTVARKCSAASSLTTSRENIGPFFYAGENVFLATGTTRPSMTDVIEKWRNDVIRKNSEGALELCVKGENCEQYTQMVWAETNSIGCSIAQCDNIEHLGTGGYVLVCHYGPGGNFHMQPPYQTGEECAICPADKTYCTKGLCCDGLSAQISCKPDNAQFRCNTYTTFFTDSTKTTQVDLNQTEGIKGDGDPLTDDEKIGLVNGHNALRGSVGASNMQCLNWMKDLEKTAQTVADKCSAAPSPPSYREKIVSQFPSIGENIYIASPLSGDSSAPSGRPSADDIVNKWTGGKPSEFDITLTCGFISDPEQSEACWSYSQMAWANTQDMGCAISYCDNIEHVNQPGWVAVCHYGPQGNIGEAPAYSVGTSCSACSSNIKSNCFGNLCCETSLDGAADTARSSGTFYSRREMCEIIKGYGYCDLAQDPEYVSLKELLEQRCHDPYAEKCFCCE